MTEKTTKTEAQAEKAKLLKDIKSFELCWDEALRAFLCMVPALIAGIMGNIATAIPLGQAGFFYLMMSIPVERPKRLVMGSLLFTLGLGFYLVGGNVVFNEWLSIFFTFFVGLNLVFLTTWKVAGPLALALFTIYSAGLNAGSPESVHNNFMAFSFALIWGTGVALLPWKPEKSQDAPSMTTTQIVETGFRFGIGTSLALLVSNILTFSKLGWAPSAVGNVIRFDEVTSKLRAKARFVATVIGSTIAALALMLFTSPDILLLFGVFLATINGLFKKTILGKMPLLYTATILILYSINDAGSPATLILQRIGYNVIGIAIGIFVVLYPFPRVFKKLKMLQAARIEDVQT